MEGAGFFLKYIGLPTTIRIGRRKGIKDLQYYTYKFVTNHDDKVWLILECRIIWMQHTRRYPSRR